MDQRTIKVMFSLIRSAISGEALSQNENELFSTELLPDLYKVSQSHTLSHLVGFGLQANNLVSADSEYYKKFYSDICSAILMCERQKFEFEQLCNYFEASKTPFIPLKGSVIRDFYPQPWLRTSCDIDILLHESDLDKCVEEYKELARLTNVYPRNSNHISVTTQSNVNIELHYDLVDSDVANNASLVLKDIWNNLHVKEGTSYRYSMNDGYFFFYHFAHMAKHFESGGCGIRPLLDLWILSKHNKEVDIYQSELLKKGNLQRFASAIKKLVDVWFEGKEHTESTLLLENYILFGGVYGTSKNKIQLQNERKGSKFKYLLSRAFISHEKLAKLFPVIKKHKWLTPFAQVARWFRVLFNGRLKYSVNELKYTVSVTDSESERLRKMLDDLGL